MNRYKLSTLFCLCNVVRRSKINGNETGLCLAVCDEYLSWVESGLRSYPVLVY